VGIVSSERSIDVTADLIECVAFRVALVCYAATRLARIAEARHPGPFVAGEQRVDARLVRAPAMTPNTIHDLRNLANLVEYFDRFLVTAELMRL
jgi:hypothetical protein